MASWSAAIGNVREAAAAVLHAALPTVHCYAFMPAAPQVPSIAIMPDSLDTAGAFGGLISMRLRLWVFVGGGDIVASQRQLDGLIGQIVAALDANPTLNGATNRTNVRGFTSYATEVQLPTGPGYSAGLDVETWVQIT